MNNFIRLLAATIVVSTSLTAGATRRVHVIKSDNLHCNDSIVVYSPDVKGNCCRQACCKNDNPEALPVLFLLHGWSGSWRDWESHTDLQALSNDFGFRIVCPDGFKDSWYINKTDSSNMQWRDFFWNELWPLIQSEYAPDPKSTFIDGLSMGGHGAMNIFLDRPDLFAGAGSMSGVLDLKYSGGSKTLIPSMVGAETIEDPQCQVICAINRLGRIKEVCGEEADSKLLVVSCGSSDATFLPASEDFVRKCQESGLKHIALFSPGKHRWEYWTWVLPFHLEWFAQHCSTID